MRAKLWGLIILLLLMVIFAVQNTQSISVKLLTWAVQTTSALLIIVTFLLGLAVGWILGTLKRPFANRPDKG